MTTLVSFIVPALNEELRVGGCLNSIRQLELPAGVHGTEIIVVDNCSTDQTAEISRQHGARVQEVPPGHPSRARNAGVRLANGDWLAFVDADCELPTNWLTICGAHLIRDEQVVAAAGTMRGPAADATWVERAWFDLAHASCATDVTQVRWLPTFNLLIRRSAFEAAGGFDESLATCEDCDLGYRLSKLGKLLVDSRTRVIHRGESRSLPELFRREAWRTQGNLRLALSRPFDGSNWLSLMFPPGVLIAFLLALVGLALAIAARWPLWPWLALVTSIVGMVALVVLKKSTSTNLVSLSKQFIVFLTYITGRAAGLVWSFDRVKRETNVAIGRSQ